MQTIMGHLNGPGHHRRHTPPWKKSAHNVDVMLLSVEPLENDLWSVVDAMVVAATKAIGIG